uniref:Uncharacterized protein n=1 Tax=Arcella intermedia TaxID=1963864 RepID=A0A6B2LVM8_9EUKA
MTMQRPLTWYVSKRSSVSFSLWDLEYKGNSVMSTLSSCGEK